jgi:hypothetical protein
VFSRHFLFGFSSIADSRFTDVISAGDLAYVDGRAVNTFQDVLQAGTWAINIIPESFMRQPAKLACDGLSSIANRVTLTTTVNPKN